MVQPIQEVYRPIPQVSPYLHAGIQALTNGSSYTLTADVSDAAGKCSNSGDKQRVHGGYSCPKYQCHRYIVRSAGVQS